MGDIHWSQGDGEITFCGAIEMAGWIDIGVDVIKGGVAKYGITNPVFKPSPVEPNYSEYLIFEGVCVDEHSGDQHYLDATVAYRRACLNAVEYLKKFGYSGEQAYMILGTAPVEGRVSGIVDIPNACCTVAIPTEIFDFDIMPNSPGRQSRYLKALMRQVAAKHVAESGGFHFGIRRVFFGLVPSQDLPTRSSCGAESSTMAHIAKRDRFRRR